MFAIIIARQLVEFPALFSGLARSQFTRSGTDIGRRKMTYTKEKVRKKIEKKTLMTAETLVCQKLAQKVKSYSCWSIKILNGSYGAHFHQLDENDGSKKDLLCMKQIQVIK